MKFSHSRRRVPYWTALCVAVLLTIGSAAALFGQYASGTILYAWMQQWIMPKSYASAAMTLAGLSLWLQIHPSTIPASHASRVRKLLAQCLAMAVILLGALSLATTWSALSQVLDPMLLAAKLDAFTLRDNGAPPLVGISFVLAGASLLWFDAGSKRKHYPAEYCALAMTAVIGVSALAMLIAARTFIAAAPALAVAPSAATPLLLLAAGILSARPDHRIMSVFFSDGPGGWLLRSVLPTTLAAIAGLNFLVDQGAVRGLYSQDMASLLAALATGAVLLSMFWRTATVLNRQYGSRAKDEAQAAKFNELLRAISDWTTAGLQVKDRNGYLKFANPAMLRILDRTLESAGGRPPQELFSDPEVAAAIDQNDQAVLANRAAQAIEIALAVEGKPRRFYLITAPWLGHRDELRGTVGIMVDLPDGELSEHAPRGQDEQLEALVQARTAEVRELIGHVQTMREEEKRALARELHDDLGSSLTALNMHLAILFQQIPSEPTVTERTAQVKSLLSAVTATTRRLQNGLRPDKLDIFGIKMAIADQAQDFENFTGITCTASLPDDEVKYPMQVEISLFRMVQEALNNVARHAKATQVDLILDEDDEGIYLTVRDNGVGISPDAAPYSSTHGLRDMRERAGYLGGHIEVAGAPGAGTRVKITIPKSPKLPEGTAKR